MRREGELRESIWNKLGKNMVKLERVGETEGDEKKILHGKSEVRLKPLQYSWPASFSYTRR